MRTPLMLFGREIENIWHSEAKISLERLQEALNQVPADMAPSGRYLTKFTATFATGVGDTKCVEVDPKFDSFEMFKRRNRNYLSRFVVGLEPQSTDKLTLLLGLSQKTKQHIVLIGAYFGPARPPEPEDCTGLRHQRKPFDEAYKESKKFWENHAFVLGTEDVCCDTCDTIIIKSHVCRLWRLLQGSNIIKCGECLKKRRGTSLSKGAKKTGNL